MLFALQDFDPAYVSSGSIVRITAAQPWWPVFLQQQTSRWFVRYRRQTLTTALA